MHGQKGRHLHEVLRQQYACAFGVNFLSIIIQRSPSAFEDVVIEKY